MSRWLAHAGLTNVAVLTTWLRFVWPLLDQGRLPADLLETSHRRLAAMWRVLGIVTLLGLLVGLALIGSY